MGENPEWGTAGRQLVRILPPDYEDKRDEPRGGLNSRTLPNPRWMSQRNHPDEDLPDTRYTHMVMQFGLFLGEPDSDVHEPGALHPSLPAQCPPAVQCYHI